VTFDLKKDRWGFHNFINNDDKKTLSISKDNFEELKIKLKSIKSPVIILYI